MKTSVLLLGSLSLCLGLVNSERGQEGVSVIHLSSDTEPGTIVKTFPHDLPGLNLLPSAHSDLFYLLQSGELMLSRPLECLTHTNLSLALTHHILNQTVLHLLSVQVTVEHSHWSRSIQILCSHCANFNKMMPKSMP